MATAPASSVCLLIRLMKAKVGAHGRESSPQAHVCLRFPVRRPTFHRAPSRLQLAQPRHPEPQPSMASLRALDAASERTGGLSPDDCTLLPVVLPVQPISPDQSAHVVSLSSV